MRGKLVAWVALVAALTAASYGSRAAGGKPDPDVLYRYSTAVGALIQYGLILLIVLVISRGERRLLALRRPSSWRWVFGSAAIVLVVTYIVGAIVETAGNPGEEQGLTPREWDPSRATQYAVNFAVIALLAPFVEELAFRGLGYSLIEPIGRVAAMLWIGLAFGLTHGLLEGLPILIVFGAGLAFIRERTQSVYPPIVVHGLFNAVALIVAVTT